MEDNGPTAENRPALSATLTGAELRRWYWLKAELVVLARALGVSTAGGKIELTERLVAALDGQVAPEAVSRAPTVDRMPSVVTVDTVLPPGQRSTQQLRAFFVEQVGPAFRFDGPMRAFIAAGNHTLGEAVEHWYETRDRPTTEIGGQFELNRFLRRWHAENPTGTRDKALAGWQRYRAMPVDGRAAVADPGTTDPCITDPGTTDPGTTEPGTTDPDGNRTP